MSLLLMGAGKAKDAGAAAFDLLSLSPNIWIEADPTKLYTNDAHSTLVAADGDAVAWANDKSGNSRHLSRSIAGSPGQQPLYKVGPPKYLSFDGTDQLSQENTAQAWVDGSGQHWFAISCYFDSNTGIQSALNLHNFSPGRELLWARNNAGTIEFQVQNAAGSTITATGGTVTAATPIVIIGTVTTSQVQCWVDNVSSGGPAAITGPETSTGFPYLGTLFGLNKMTGRVYGFAQGSGTIDATTRGNLQTYFAALHP